MPKTLEVKRMWPGGPLRQFAKKRPHGSWTGYQGGGFVNSYVCDKCGNPADMGVYGPLKTADGAGTRWICGPCRDDENAIFGDKSISQTA